LAKKDFPSSSLAKERKLSERGLERGSFSYTTYQLELRIFLFLLLFFGKGLLSWIRVWARRRC
jgi:hypothetical protein